MSIDFVQGQILSLASGGFMDLERCESEYGCGNYRQWRCLGMTPVVNVKESLLAELSKEIIPHAIDCDYLIQSSQGCGKGMIDEIFPQGWR